MWVTSQLSSHGGKWAVEAKWRAECRTPRCTLVELFPPNTRFFSVKRRLLVIHMATKASKRLIRRQLINYHSTSSCPLWLISDGAGPKCQIMWVIHHPRCGSVPSIPPVSSWWMLPFGPMREYPTALWWQEPYQLKPRPHLTLTSLPLPPYLSHGLLYCYCIITLPKCNLLKHALTRLLKSGAKKLQLKKKKT